MTKKDKKAKILIWDLETSLAVAAVFSLFPDRIGHNHLISDPYIMCGAYKWLGEKTVHAISMTKKELEEKDDKRVVKRLSEVLASADVIIAHNGDKFDTKYIKARMLKHGITPISFPISIDTLKISRRHFKIMSHRLDYLAQYLGVGQKMSTKPNLWMDVLKGKVKALKEMVKYNKVDVEILEETYLKLLPWIENHPNLNVINGTVDRCPSCSGNKFIKYGFKLTRTGKYQKHQCQDCFSISCLGKNLMSTPSKVRR